MQLNDKTIVSYCTINNLMWTLSGVFKLYNNDALLKLHVAWA